MRKTFIVLMLLILSSYLYADHWSTYEGIELSGSYPRFAVKGGYVSFMGYASDKDQRTDSNNNQYTVYDSFSFNSNASNWNVGFSNLTNITQSSSQSGNSFSTYYYAKLPNNISCGDYSSTITVNDMATMGPNDTGSRDDSPASANVTTTIIDLNLSYNAQSTYTNNNVTYDLILSPLNNDDDDNDGITDNQDDSVSGEDDLVPITINVNPKNSATSQYCKLRFTLSGCRLFKNNNRTNEITNNEELNVSSLEQGETNYHKTVYAEATYGMGSITVMLYSNYQTPENIHMTGSNAGISKTVYIAPNSVNISDINGNDTTEMTSPGSVLGLTDDLNTPSKMLSLSYSLNNAITDYNIKINKSNNNVKLFYYTYENYMPVEHEITNNTTFQKGSIPTSITAKGYNAGSTVITATLNVTEIDNSTHTINNFHSDSLLINVVEADITLSNLSDALETVSPGFVLGLNKSNAISFALNNVNSDYAGYKATLQVPNNIELYTDDTLSTIAQRNYTIGTDTLPTTLYMKGISGTSGTLSYLFNNPSNNLIHKDSVLINVIYCDLAVDSNNDGTINQTLNGNDDIIEETSPGMYIPNNTDDDDYDGIVDNLDDTMTGMGDSDLRELRLQAYIFGSYMGGTNPYTGYYVKLSYSDNLKLYGSRSKKTASYNNGITTYTDTYVPTNSTWTVGTNTPLTTLYIEGLENGLGNIDYAVYNANDVELFKDRVVISVVETDIDFNPDVETDYNFPGMIYPEILYIDRNNVEPIYLDYRVKANINNDPNCCIRLTWDNNVTLYTDMIGTIELIPDEIDGTVKTWYVSSDTVPTVLYARYTNNGNSLSTISLKLMYNNSGTLREIATDSVQIGPSNNLLCFDYIQKKINSSDYLTWIDYYKDDVLNPNSVSDHVYTGRWLNYNVPFDTLANDQPYLNCPYKYKMDNENYDINRPFLVPRNSSLSLKDVKFYSSTSPPMSSYISATTNTNMSYTMNYNFHVGTSSETINGLINTYENKDYNGQKFDVSFTGIPSQTVDFKKLIIDWKLNGVTIGQTKHKLYVTFDTPISSDNNYNETCVWIGCTAAKGKSTEQEVFDAIWSEFQTMTITTRDNRLLSYWGNGEFTEEYFTTNTLLEHSDGRCNAWSEFFFDTIRLQGLGGIYKYFINFNSLYKDVGNVRYTSLGLKQLGNIFQGRLTLSSEFIQNEFFANHALNKYNNYYYDCSVQKNIIYDDIEDYLANNIEIWGFNNTTLTYEKIEPYNYNITYSSFFQYQLCNLDHINGICNCQPFLCQPEGE